MAKRKRSENQIVKLPEYSDLVSSMEQETASIITDYIRQYVGVANKTPEPGSGIFMNFDRVLQSQTYQELAWYDLYAEVERDTHVSSVIQTAKLNVAGMAHDIYPYIEDGQKKPSSRDKAIASFVKDAIKGLGYFPQHLYNMMDAIGKGFSCSEIIWETTDGGIYPKALLNRPQRRIQFDAVSRTPKIRNLKNPYLGDPLPDKKFVIHRISSTWENPFGDALDQSVYWMWLFKRMVLKFYMAHLEVSSSSVPIIKHPVNSTNELKDEALAIAQQIRSGAYGRIPANFEIIWAVAQDNDPQSYDGFIRLCNDEISKCVNGQVLTTDATSATGTGSQALGNVHQGTQSHRDTYRAEGLASTLNHTLIKWIVDFNFADVEGYPELRFEQEQAKDLMREAEIVSTIIGAGFDIPEEELSERFDYTITKKKSLDLGDIKPKVDENGKPIIEKIENNEKDKETINNGE